MTRVGLSLPEVAAVAGRFRAAQVLVVGDVILDAYVEGSVDRCSPEAPVPVVAVAREWESLGGAANVAHQVAAFNATPRLLGVVGDDDDADRVLQRCREAGIDPSGLVRDTGRPTTRKQRILADRQQVARLDTESTSALAPEIEARLLAALERCDRPDAVVLSDYGKGVVTDAVLRAVTEAAHRWDVPLLVDPKRTDLGDHRGASTVKLNRVEFEASLHRRLQGRSAAELVAELADDAEAMRQRAGVGALVVTLGEHGMAVVDGSGVRHHPTQATSVFDVSGAGDTVVAALALAVGCGVGLDVGVDLANVAASVAVRRVGVTVVTTAELLAEIGARVPTPVVARAELSQLVAAWRTAERRVVFTNGCFDLFHEGHLALVRAAAGAGDELVVAVNGDRSVRELKGPSRPVVGEAERCAVVAGIAGVSAVVVFDGHDLLDLLGEVRPDVLVKGADYRLEDVVGADLVAGWGGRVDLVELVPGRSTTALVERLQGGDASDKIVR